MIVVVSGVERGVDVIPICREVLRLSILGASQLSTQWGRWWPSIGSTVWRRWTLGSMSPPTTMLTSFLDRWIIGEFKVWWGIVRHGWYQVCCWNVCSMDLSQCGRLYCPVRSQTNQWAPAKDTWLPQRDVSVNLWTACYQLRPEKLMHSTDSNDVWNCCRERKNTSRSIWYVGETLERQWLRVGRQTSDGFVTKFRFSTTRMVNDGECTRWETNKMMDIFVLECGSQSKVWAILRSSERHNESGRQSRWIA